MYGYIVVNKPELKFREYEVYHSHYCGLCAALGERHGVQGKLSISYDMTFLILLLTGLYEPPVRVTRHRCVAHPASKHPVRRSVVTDYVADMNVLMTYYKCMDDWKDEHQLTRRAMAAGLAKSVSNIGRQYPQKCLIIRNELERLSQFERNQETNIDQVAACFGTIMAELAVMQPDAWEDTLRRMGFQLGKFIYLLDAYEDLAGDLKAGRYNVFAAHRSQENFDGLCEGILNSVMAECAKQFERLPILEDVEILRNIIYSGVWTRFEIVRRRGQQRKRENKIDGSI